MRGKRLSIGLRAALAIFTVTAVGDKHLGGYHWNEKVLHSFGNGTDGINPPADLIFDTAGNLYGTTYEGGDLQLRDGVRVDAHGGRGLDGEGAA